MSQEEVTNLVEFFRLLASWRDEESLQQASAAEPAPDGSEVLG